MLAEQQGIARHWKTVSDQLLCGPLWPPKMQGTLRSQCLQATAVFLMCSPASARETLEQFQWAGQLASHLGLIPCVPLDTVTQSLPVLHTLARSALITALHLSLSGSKGKLVNQSPVHFNHLSTDAH